MSSTSSTFTAYNSLLSSTREDKERYRDAPHDGGSYGEACLPDSCSSRERISGGTAMQRKADVIAETLGQIIALQ